MEETVEAVAQYQKTGYKAIRAQSGIPGLESTYGVASGAGHYEPAEKNAPPENQWSTEAYMNFIPTLFARLRKEFGPELHLLHDVHHRLTPNEAARVGKALEPYRLFWMEDPTPAELQESFRLIRQHTTTPMAVGEVFNSIWDCQTPDPGAVDRLHSDDGGARGRDHAFAADCEFGGDVPGADGIAWGDGFESGVHGSRAAL